MSAEFYTKVTEQIVSQMERGVSPWHQPWQSGKWSGQVSRTIRSTGEKYQGINVLLLWARALEKSYDSPRWLTFNQCKDFGGSVRKGEKGTHIVYYSTFTKREELDNGETAEQKIPFLKTYVVFNAQQCDGLPSQFQPDAQPIQNQFERLEHCQQFFTNVRADWRTGGNRAFYLPALDYIQTPELETFEDQESYWGTVAHEFAHWTRAEKRLNRTFNQKRFGDDGYAMEELVAEMAAAFLCADLGIEASPREDHAAYLAGWLSILKQDSRAIFTAASYASKAADFLHGLQPVAETVSA